MSLPWRAVCEGHCAPLDAAWDIYSGKVDRAIIIGSRGSGKTTTLAMLHALFALTQPGCQSASIAPERQQSARCYDAFRKSVLNNPLLQQYVVRTTQHHTRLANDSEVYLLTATIKGVNSAHPSKVFFDEVELFDFAILQEALNMAISRGDIKAQNIFTSTWKAPRGPLKRLVEDIGKETAITDGLYVWCVFEVIRGSDCDDCSLCKRVSKTLPSGEVITFADLCRGRARNATGFLPVKDALKKFIELDYPTFKAQWLSQEPTPVYAVFELHDYNILSQWNPFEAARRFQTVIYCAIDVGYSAPTVALFAQILPSGTCIVFDEVRAVGQTFRDTIMQHILPRVKRYGVHQCIVDPHSPQSVQELLSVGIPAIAAPLSITTRDKLTRIGMIRSALTPVGGIPSLLITKQCKELLDEMISMEFKTDATGTPTDKLPDKHDDGVDALSYLYAYLYEMGATDISLEQMLAYRQAESELIKRYMLSGNEGQLQSEHVLDILGEEKAAKERPVLSNAVAALSSNPLNPQPLGAMQSQANYEYVREVEEIESREDLSDEEKEKELIKRYDAATLKQQYDAAAAPTGFIPLFADALLRWNP